MYKLSIPISMITLTDENRHIYLDWLQKCGAQRVFLCCIGSVYTPDSLIHTDPERLRRTITYFRSADLEVGIWFNGFGHGSTLSGADPVGNPEGYMPLAGVMGETVTEALCPLDVRFAARYRDAVAKLAALEPDILMLDDDFRLNSRGYYMGCFCPLHLEEYYRRVGQVIPREQLEGLIFTGGKNKYRTAYMEMQRDTLLDFARMLRRAVDAVAPSVRLGACTVLDNWDYTGTDAIEIAKAFAGSTAPYLRTIGAPYWKGALCAVIEDTRLQQSWCAGSGVEVFAEGDTYPRPRYNVSSARLELYDLALLADGTGDGILKYMFDYTFRHDYEPSYGQRHIRNAPLRQQVQALFAGKKPVGVRSFNVMHKIENWILPDTPPTRIASRLVKCYRSASRSILAGNSIPTAYEDRGWPVQIFGENARYVTAEDLKNGALLDAPAAQILMERGIDTGTTAMESGSFTGEHFEAAQDTVRNLGAADLKRIACKDGANVLSRFLPGNTPAAYTYENAAGQRFLVLACDWYMSDVSVNYFENYYRQAQLIDGLQWAGRKNLPAVCVKNPGLYLLTSSDGSAMSVAMLNIFDDDILLPVVKLDKAYSGIRFVNCTGTLEGDTVRLETMAPYSFAAFEVY